MSAQQFTATVRAEPGERLTPAEASRFLEQIPSWATLDAIMLDKGSQRDPVPYLNGLRATWSNEPAGT